MVQGLRVVTHSTCYGLSMLDFPPILQVKLPVVDTIYPESNEFSTGVQNKATGNSTTN